MKTGLIIIAAAIALCALPARAIAAPPLSTSAVQIVSVSALDLGTNTWTIGLSTHDTLHVELRAFDTGGTSPSVGPISSFSDQGWLPILGYYGYATFVQKGITYHATH